MKVKLKTDPSGTTTINRNDQQLTCPYQPALALPGQLSGQIQIMRMPCSSLCPMFEIGTTKIVLHCTRTEMPIETLELP